MRNETIEIHNVKSNMYVRTMRTEGDPFILGRNEGSMKIVNNFQIQVGKEELNKFVNTVLRNRRRLPIHYHLFSYLAISPIDFGLLIAFRSERNDFDNLTTE